MTQLQFQWPASRPTRSIIGTDSGLLGTRTTTVPGTDLRWALAVTGMPEDVHSPYDFDGPWISLVPGNSLCAPGDLIIACSFNTQIQTLLYLPNDIWFSIRDGAQAKTTGWARRLAPIVRAWLDRSPVERIRLAASEGIATMSDVLTHVLDVTVDDRALFEAARHNYQAILELLPLPEPTAVAVQPSTHEAEPAVAGVDLPPRRFTFDEWCEAVSLVSSDFPVAMQDRISTAVADYVAVRNRLGHTSRHLDALVAIPRIPTETVAATVFERRPVAPEDRMRDITLSAGRLRLRTGTASNGRPVNIYFDEGVYRFIEEVYGFDGRSMVIGEIRRHMREIMGPPPARSRRPRTTSEEDVLIDQIVGISNARVSVETRAPAPASQPPVQPHGRRQRCVRVMPREIEDDTNNTHSKPGAGSSTSPQHQS